VILVALQSTTAASQDMPTASSISASPQPLPQDQAGNAGDDFDRPLTLFQLRYEYETAPGNGSAPGTTGIVTSDILNLLHLARPAR